MDIPRSDSKNSLPKKLYPYDPSGPLIETPIHLGRWGEDILRGENLPKSMFFFAILQQKSLQKKEKMYPKNYK